MGDSNDDEVGYGKPPKQHRFKPGQSGNPFGRPRKAKTAAEVIAEIRDEKIPMTINGRRRKVGALEATLRAVINKTLTKGNPRDLEYLWHLLEKHGGPSTDTRAEEARQGADAVIRKIMTAMSRADPLPPDPDPELTAAVEELEARELRIIADCSDCAKKLDRTWSMNKWMNVLKRRKTRLYQQLHDASARQHPIAK